MKLTDQHKAALITFFITASVVMGTFSFHIKQRNAQIAETFYELLPEDPVTKEQVEELEQKIKELKEGTKAETNKAFNQDQGSKRFAQAYKPIAPPKDYEYTPSPEAQNSIGEQKQLYDRDNVVRKEESERFNKANDILKQQLERDGNNSNTTMGYSLKGREMLNDPTPIYLCEEGGKIVITVQVNGEGEVIDAYVNSSSSTENQCLEDNALEYAMKAIFTPDSSKEKQIGTITWVFQGKN